MTRHTDFSTTPRRPPLGTGAIVLLAAAALAAAAAGVAAWSARRDVDAARGRLAAVQRETDQLRARTRAFEARGLRGRDVVGARAWLTSAAPPPRLLAEMGELLPPDVRLEGVTLRYGSRLDLEMRVVAREARSYDAFLKRLAASPRIEDLTPGTENRDGEVRATVRASYRPGGLP